MSRPGDDGAELPAGLDVSRLFARVEEKLLGGPRKYTRFEVAQRAGIDPADARLLWRALGFATVADDDMVFTDGDVEALKRVQYFAESAGLDEELLSGMTRVLGRTFARLASWQGQLLLEQVSTHPELVSSEDALVAFVDDMVPLLEQTQSFVWRRQIVAYLSRIVSQTTGEAAAPGTEMMAVGFADMSGYTTLSRRASESELREVLEAFEAVTTDVVGDHAGRIVKTIGDEILFVADSPEAGVEIALQLMARAAADERLPRLRVGVAAGPVVSRLGDVFGSTVNIASRLTSLARPGWVLIDRIMADTLRDDPRYTLKSRRPESVRGYHHLRAWRVMYAGEQNGRHPGRRGLLPH